MDGSSFVQDGLGYAGAAVVNNREEIIWADALPPGTSTQKAELIALAEALERAEGKRLTVYTDSHYAYATLHILGSIYRECGFKNTEGREIKNQMEILCLLSAVTRPRMVAVVHTPGHQRGHSPEARGNRAADQAAKRAALQTV
ncbi:ribonuclease H-like [Orycteropus afer afer]|uniref:Ribonuclease H-like n=1 Tax=Orycteropus afer afer TaxID=1230840 RepID=A0AC54ZBD7_ORYAF|nr:ribonuclease H-like [Orycteropus afer afer]